MIDIKAIKLIIWDLDETFWSGTLSEGSVTMIPENVQMLKKLTGNGIVNSICSKNDPILVEEVLKKEGLWHLFVFPSVDWTPKGQRISEIITDMSLRAENVLFIDDNISNLEEARYYQPELQILNASELYELYEAAEPLDPNAKDYKRLDQYKILYTKVSERKKSSSNEDFLRQSKIKVAIHENCADEADRIEEMIHRTNQLNYTKNRMGMEELIPLLQSDEYRNGTVYARDIYGDYGCVGYYCMNKKDNSLVHFLFSCRTLGMGIEQYVYEKLDFPQLTVVGAVASEVSKQKKVTWIEADSEERIEVLKQNSKTVKTDILFKGPCDLLALIQYFENKGRIATEFNYVNSQGISITGFNVSTHILEGMDCTKEEIGVLLRTAPFLDEGDFKTRMFDAGYRLIFYSLLPDEHQGIYRNKQNGLRISFSTGNRDLTDPNNWDKFISGEYSNHNYHFNQRNLKEFAENYEFEGFLPTDQIVLNLKEIRKRLPKESVLVLLGGSEIECDVYEPNYVNHAKRHKEVNAYVQNAFKDDLSVEFVNFTDYIQDQSDYMGCINHFGKRAYHRIAKRMEELMNQYTEKKVKAYSSFGARVRYDLHYYAKRIIGIIKGEQ